MSSVPSRVVCILLSKHRHSGFRSSNERTLGSFITSVLVVCETSLLAFEELVAVAVLVRNERFGSISDRFGHWLGFFFVVIY